MWTFIEEKAMAFVIFIWRSLELRNAWLSRFTKLKNDSYYFMRPVFT